tara:strand:- start:742 stop:948 length:207 start_codon:yes stop_codon:yes gene_type:complete
METNVNQERLEMKKENLMKLVSGVGYATSSICLLCALHIGFPTREALVAALIIFGMGNITFLTVYLKH